jgi:hypothetical protein
MAFFIYIVFGLKNLFPARDLRHGAPFEHFTPQVRLPASGVLPNYRGA